MDTMCFTVQGKNGEKPLELNYERVFAIGYAGRNIEKTMEHIKELERELGVPAPKKIPTIFHTGKETGVCGRKDLWRSRVCDCH